jgi:Cu-processing system permease protein
MEPLRAAIHLAAKEMSAHLRSWWIVIMGSVCALLSALIGSYGFSFASGQAGAQSVLVSLLHLQLYIVPLLGLLLAYDAILGERDSGMFDLHMSLGVSRWTLLAGKWMGLYACLLVAVAPGMLLQAYAFHAAGGGVESFLALLLYSAILASVIISIGLLISSCSLQRGTVVSLTVGTWIVLVVLLDLIVVGLLAATEGDVPDWLVNSVILFNPLGSYRLLTYAHFFPDQVEALLHARHVGVVSALLIMGLWTVGPVWLAALRLRGIHRPIEFHAEPELTP